MWFSRVRLWRHPNLPDLNRQPWNIGYRGPSLFKYTNTKWRTIHWPVSEQRVQRLRQRLHREYNVMKCLATPAITNEEESAWLAKHGTVREQADRLYAQEEHTRMPGKEKRLTGVYRHQQDKRNANIGNLLHKHRTIEHELAHITLRQRHDY